jgi:hypothetical protein
MKTKRTKAPQRRDARSPVGMQTVALLHRAGLALELKALACWLNGSDSDHERVERAEKRAADIVDELTGHAGGAAARGAG